jgi:hypothetical protein
LCDLVISGGEDRARTKDGERDEHRTGEKYGYYWTEEMMDGRDVGRKRRDGGGEGMATIDE